MRGVVSEWARGQAKENVCMCVCVSQMRNINSKAVVNIFIKNSNSFMYYSHILKFQSLSLSGTYVWQIHCIVKLWYIVHYIVFSLSKDCGHILVCLLAWKKCPSIYMQLRLKSVHFKILYVVYHTVTQIFIQYCTDLFDF